MARTGNGRKTMNVEIAQRLANMRREKGYSQEALASKLGLSRQAVSKWERAESQPDTGNLIALADLYGVTLDELVRVEADIADDVRFEEAQKNADAELRSRTPSAPAAASSTVGAPASGANPTTAATPNPAASEPASDTNRTATEAPTSEALEAASNGAGAAASEAAPAAASAAPAALPSQPVPNQGTPAGAVPGQPLQPAAAPGQPFAYGAPAPGTAPVPPMAPPPQPAPQPPRQRSPWYTFPYPLLVVVLFLLAGFLFHAWNPAWVLFLTIPFYYWIASVITNDPNYRASRNDGSGYDR